MLNRNTLFVWIGIVVLSGMFLEGQEGWELKVPVITGIDPGEAMRGEEVTISGVLFGSSQDSNTVRFNGIDAGSASIWSDQEIKINVPELSTSGPVTISINGENTNDILFKVVEASQEIGEEGGILEIIDTENPIYGVKIDIPVNAIDHQISITVEDNGMPNRLSDVLIPAGPVIDIGPDQTSFNEAVHVTLTYNDADNDGMVDYTGVEETDILIVTYNATDGLWEEVPVLSQNIEYNKVTCETMHFSQYSTAVSPINGDWPVQIFTIDGLNFMKTILNSAHIPVDHFMDPFRSAYLREAIQEMDLGLNFYDIFSFGNKSGIIGWSGDATETPELVKNVLNSDLKEAYSNARANGKKFILVTHSWGTILGILGLQYNPDIVPDLFITLSSPLTSNFISDYNDDIFWDLIFPLPNIEVGWMQEVIAGFSQVQIQDTYNQFSEPHDHFNYERWINYWDDGDVISGPMTPVYDLYASSTAPIVEDVKINLYNWRDKDTTKYTHALTSLNSKTWEKYEVMGYPTRNLVKQEICLAIGDIDQTE